MWPPVIIMFYVIYNKNRINAIPRKAMSRGLTLNCVWHRRSYWQGRSQTLSAGHSARSQSAPSSPP